MKSHLLALILCFPLASRAQDVPNKTAYDSWKMAGRKDGNTAMVPPPTEIQAPEGFKVELIRVAAEEEDSWISLCFDDEDRLFLGMEDKGILRLTFSGEDKTDVVDVKVVNDHLGEPRGLLWAYDSLYVNANDSKGFFRLRDTTGDDVFDEEKLLLLTGGGVGHGRNHLRLGPDGMIYIVHGNDPKLANPSPDSPFKNYGEDQLIPNPWDDSWNRLPVPAGQILRTDKDGTKFEAICGGLRNPLDIDFNLDGEPFVYDADSEWDAGLAWYKPTRILHIIPGGEYGWRRGTGKWPAYYEDSLPSVYGVGLGSPTGVGFAYKSNFPEPWRSSFMIADWSYGRILAVDIQPDGASYKGTEARHFLSGRPLNLTDFVFGPDGAMWFTTGGRRTQSALYRVSWTGEKPKSSPKKLPRPEGFSGPYVGKPSVKDDADYLNSIFHQDRVSRFSNRISIENHIEGWKGAILHSQNPWALMALARVGGKSDRGPILKILSETIEQGLFDEPTGSVRKAETKQGGKLARQRSEDSATAEPKDSPSPNKQGTFDEQTLLTRLRAIQLACIRQGPPTEDEKQMLRDALEPLYPHALQNVNHELCEMLVYFRSDKVLQPTLTLIEESDDTRDWSHYLVFLRYLEDEMWTTDDRRRYLGGLKKFDSFAGGRWWIRTGEDLRKEFVARLSDDEKIQFAALTPPQQPKVEPPIIAELDPAKFVKNWTMEDFADTDFSKERDVKRGAAVYVKAQCAVCHKKAGNAASERAFFGPDLSQIGARFGPSDMLESMIHPNRVIGDKYRNPSGPNISTMPPGLINLLEKNEIMDLIGYLRAEGPKQ